MGSLVAVLGKKSQNVRGKAAKMVKAFESEISRTYGIASPTTVETEKSFEALMELDMRSPILVGWASSRIFPNDTPQPLRLEDAAIVFDGRMYSDDATESDSEIAAKKLGRNVEQAVSFIKKTDGDFAFAVAEGKTIIAGRDVLGVRPLYYGENADVAALASERKALWAVGIKEVRSFPPGCASLVGSCGFKFTVAKRIVYSRPKQITMETAAHRLQALLQNSVKKRVSGLREVAVAFSGGLDSSVIVSLVKRTGVNVVLVHVSLENEPEVGFARQAAEELKLPLCSCVYAEREVQKVVQKVIHLVEEPNPVKVSIGVPIYWAAQKAAKMDCRVMLAGQGADELFGGYKRYQDDYVKGGSENTQKAIFKDIVGMYEANLERDFKICNHFNVELRLPFATYGMARFAIRLPLDLKMEQTDKTLRKLVLRRVAANLGLSRSIVDKPKRAIQYTTGVNGAIKRMAKKDGQSMAEYLRRVFQTTF
jgi:asparagine synthase (glutamine-hydrolysing)